MMTMTLDYKIETIREFMKGLPLNSNEERTLLYSILNILQDISDEIDELHHTLT
jgi:hypothetical protein